MKQRTRMVSRSLMLMAGLALLARGAGGGTLYVATNGAAPNNGSLWSTAFTNVQDALNAATSGDAICIAGHTFTATSQVDWAKSGLTVSGGYAATNDSDTPGPSDPALWPTVLTRPATGYGRLLRLQGVTNGVLRDVVLSGGRLDKDSGADLYVATSSNITLSGVTVRNGYGYSGNGGTLYGAGIYVGSSRDVRLLSCVITGNSFSVNAATARGAGLYATGSTLLASNCVIELNTSTPLGWQSAVGAGVCLEGGTNVLRDCVIRGNYGGASGAGGYGGGIYISSGVQSLRNCLVALNKAYTALGDGLYVGGGTVNLDNCTVAQNFGYGLYRAGGTVVASNCIVWANCDDVYGSVALTACSVQDGDSNGVSGCLSADPLFERGYRLATNSLCVNAGTGTVAGAGLEGYTTRADGVADADTVDLGYHYTSGVPASVADLYVAPLGTNTNSGIDWANALRTISKALSLAQEGTRIHVATGVYSTAAGEVFPLTILRSGVQILGTNAAATVLNGAAAQRLVTVYKAGGDAAIEGLTLTNGYSSASAGGGLYGYMAALRLSSCEVRNCYSWANGTAYGGGLYFAHAFAEISNCLVRANYTTGPGWASFYGGGLYSTGDGMLSICDSVFATNSNAAGTRYGGGLAIYTSGEGARLRNCAVVQNHSTANGGGIIAGGTALLLNHCTLADNANEGIRQAAGTVTISNSILWANGDDVRDVPAANLAYCDVEDGDNAGVNGCISADPGFADRTYYHLASRAGFYSNGFFSAGTWAQSGSDSALIDAGHPASPFSREPQPSGRRANLGAYGNSPVASRTFLEEPGVFTSLTVHAYPASDLGTDYATLNGEILHDGGAEAPLAYFCWGPSDAGTSDTSLWAHVESMGAQPAYQGFAKALTSLSGAVQYRCYVTNSTGSDWSLLESFSLAAPPTVTNTGAVSVRRRTAQLTGRIADSGGSTPSCWFYYWPAGGATSVVAAGEQTGGFTNALSALQASTLYTYRVLASNSAGAAWSDDSAFQTLGANVGWYVATNGDGTIGTNWPTAYRDIPSALAVAEAGDTLYVAGHTFERQTAIAWSNSSVSLSGSYEGIGLPGASSAAQWPTIIRKQATYSPRLLELQGVSNVAIERVILQEGARDATYGANLMMSGCTNVTLRDVTLRGGVITAGNGGSTWGAGAYIGGSTNILLESCTITNNTMSVNASDAKGAALYLASSAVTLSNCLVRDNRIVPGGWLVPQGHGIYITGGSVRFLDTVITRNGSAVGSTVDSDGGGIYVASGAHSLRNCVIATNDCAYEGDGLYVAGGTVALDFSTLAANLGYGVAQAAGTVSISNSILWANGDDVRDVPAANLSSCNVEDGDNSGNNDCVSVDPLFVDQIYFHVQSRGGNYTGGYFAGGAWGQSASDSPMIDSANPAAGWAREPQPNGRQANLGAYGNSPVASKTFLEEPGVFSALTVHAYPASNVGPDYGTLSGEVLHAGGAENPAAYICWGPADGGTGATGAWAHVESMGAQPEWQVFTKALSSVSGTIHYRCYVTNSTGSDWSLLESFVLASPPTVSNTAAVSIRRRTAELTGVVNDTGGATPSCWFYYWPAAGATSVVAAGEQTAGFTNQASGLLADTLYTYRILASNSAGTAWSTDASFQTLGANVGWYVATNGDGTIGTNWPTAYRDIPSALAVAEPGDTLYVAGHTFERQTAIAWSNSSVSLFGSYEGVGLPGASSVAQWPTIVRKQATYAPRLLQLQSVSNVVIDRVILQEGARDATYGANLMMSGCTNVTLRDVTLRGGTITSGSGGSTWGAGAYIGGSTNVLLDGCTITNNTMSVNASDAKGAALYLANSSVTFSNCLVRDNRIIPGGWLIPHGNGIYITGGAVRFVRSVIARNSSTAGSTADADGGGLYVASGTHSLLNCLILTNACVYNGDGLYVAGGAVTLESCTVADNAGEGLARAGGTLTVRNSILWDNGIDVNGAAGLSFCDIEDGTSNGVEGCFSADPLFVDRTFYHVSAKAGHYTGGFFSGGAWDFGLANSPCIDAGDRASAFNQEPDPNGRRINVGAYGNTDVASITTLPIGSVFKTR